MLFGSLWVIVISERKFLPQKTLTIQNFDTYRTFKLSNKKYSSLGVIRRVEGMKRFQESMG